MSDIGKVDILFLAHNRREYTEESLWQLVANTNWDRVSMLICYQDSSSEDPCSWKQVQDLTSKFRVPVIYQVTNLRSPVAVVNHYLQCSQVISAASWFAKIDNDTIVPPDWLDACISIAETDAIDLIGIESRYCQNPPMPVSLPGTCYPIVKWCATPDHVGGIGLFRREVFTRHALPKPNNTFYGFTEWQWEHPDVRKAWIDPPLPVFLLDHLPFEPWKSLGEEYERKGWQRRQWGYYAADRDRALWEWWCDERLRKWQKGRTMETKNG